MPKRTFKLAIVHDFLAEYGGAERVVEALHELFPQAPIYTAFIDLRSFGSKKATFAAMDLRPTYLQKFPLCSQLRSPYRLFAPGAFRRLDLSAYDVVISSTNAYHAKAVQVRPGALHLCYCHTPARSLYGLDSRGNWRANSFTNFFGQLINHFLRLTDFETAQNPTLILANSHLVRQRIKKYWRRDSLVVYPPAVPRQSAAVKLVDDRRIIAKSYTNDSKIIDKSYLFVGRLTYAKHPELAVQACLDLNLPLTLVGTGPLLGELQQLVSHHPRADKITFAGQVSDTQLAQLYTHSCALIFPAIDEDFGIVPVEAMAFGVPVIAHRSGGPLETVIDGKTGLFFSDLTLASLKTALKKFSRLQFNPSFIQKHAQKFSESNFQKQIMNLISHHGKKN